MLISDLSSDLWSSDLLPADQVLHRRIRIPVRVLDLAAVTILHVDAAEDAATQGLAAGYGANGRVHLAVVPAVHAQAQVAAVELVGVAQADVDRLGDGVAAAVCADAAQDLVSVDHIRLDVVHPNQAYVHAG